VAYKLIYILLIWYYGLTTPKYSQGLPVTTIHFADASVRLKLSVQQKIIVELKVITRSDNSITE
jgi:hypothetical protein